MSERDEDQVLATWQETPAPALNPATQRVLMTRAEYRAFRDAARDDLVDGTGTHQLPDGHWVKLSHVVDGRVDGYEPPGRSTR